MKINYGWQLSPEYSDLSELFGNLENVYALQGEVINSDNDSDVIRIEHHGIRYYVKRYYIAGKGLRKFFGKPRVQGEWESLQLFQKFGIPTASIVAYGYERRFGSFKRGAIITQEIPDSRDLAEIAASKDGLISNNAWVKIITAQLAIATRVLHQNKFIHNDLKWRNILIDKDSRVYLIDCPLGGFWRGYLLHYRIIKDIKCLDHLAKINLRRAQRLAFYKIYADTERLSPNDKTFIREMLNRKSRRYDN